VRLDADPKEIKAIVLPAKADWFVSYASALVLNASQKPVDAAEMLVGGLKGNPQVRKERVQHGMRVLRAAVATLQPKAPSMLSFATKEGAAKAIVWLTMMLDLDHPQAPVTLDDLISLAHAGVKAETADADDILLKAADRLDKRAAEDKATGYRGFARAYLDDVAAASAEQAITKCERAQAFAQRVRKANLLKEAAELNAEAVALKANTLFARAAANDKGAAKFRAFADAIEKAKQSDGFVLPVAVAALESALHFAKDDLQTIISEGDAALALDLPADAWWETLRYRGLVRLGDAKLLLLVKKGAAQEKFDPATEYGAIVNLYEKAKTPAGKYGEKYQGELSFKIGTLHFFLGNYKKSYQELSEAKTKINSIPQPYPVEVRADIQQALSDINALLGRKELMAFDGEK
jgi:hypothetical protein